MAEKDEFVLALDFYDRNGKVASIFSFGMPDLDADLTVDMFEVPKQARTTMVRNNDERAKIIMKYDPDLRRPSFFMRIANWFGGLFSGIGRSCSSAGIWLFESTLSMHPSVLLIPAAVCIPSAIIIKKRGGKNLNRPMSGLKAGNRTNKR